MHMICLVKQVPDPETPSASFRVDSAANKVVPATGVAPVISPFDEQAVEVALRIKDKHGGTVTAVSMGPASARDAIKHALAMGCDDGILIDGPAFEYTDSYSTAYTLAAAIKKIGDADIILCGRQAADWDGGQVGIIVSEMLGIPALINGQSTDIIGDKKIKFERVLPDGLDVYESATPAVVTFSQEVGQPRYPTLRNIMAAARKEVPVWGPAELGFDPNEAAKSRAKTKLERLFVPVFEAKVEIIEGENPAESGRLLAMKLREAKII